MEERTTETATPMIPIFQMGSFSRSGETLMLRCLNAHSRISVVHQIVAEDTDNDKDLFVYLRDESATAIEANHPKVAHKNLQPNDVLVLKNAVWIHRYPFNGFVLVRNPFSTLRSLGVFDENFEDYIGHKQRIFSWARGIDNGMRPGIRDDTTADAVALLWTRKMLALYETGLPIVRYEDFVSDPEVVLKKVVRHLGMDWEQSVLDSHQNYKEGDIGHGGIRLWELIHPKSKNSHSTLGRRDFDRVYALTAPVLERFGYVAQKGNLEIVPIDDRF